MIHTDGLDFMEGEFLHGKLSGFGRGIDGDEFYVGEYKADEYDGEGTVVYLDGSSYQGAFKDGMKHGPGKLTTSDGKSKEGKWREDQL